ncbi:DUF350 domain-containing protein [Microtetraspora sp. NBRC 16547]|uniref:DUF350 domain-containing protein n=1 Tax=Microtetraspora sp. NBRC 16547 TaxID=3030993 RepID=UPI00249FE509|nr:DUF350 domain-containing protein [Microtetraspora sp. NBRC 16547]GLX00826.1 DUF350 domain-containing protein [Microtetraspora sp. NBRC 16547]
MLTTQSTSLAEVLGNGALAITAYAVLGVLLLVAGFHVIDMAIPGRLSRLIREERNANATALTASGLVAVGLIVAASIWSSGGALREGLLATLVFGLVGIAVQTIAMIVLPRIIGIPVRSLVGEAALQPATVLLSATHIVIGLITAVAVV